MRVLRIDLVAAAGSFAFLRRKMAGRHVDVEILWRCPDESGYTEHTHHVRADDRDEQWSMAKILQHALGGYEGTEGDIAEYFRIIQMFAD